jgi:large conductance mechanosensitive channel
MIKEFREFIMRGNVIDLAVGLVMGAAFTAIVTSLVNDIFMPIIGVIMGGVDFTGLGLVIGDATIAWGNFVQAVINFLVVAVALFFVIKSINAMQRKPEPKPAEPPAPPEDVKLLTEIRDLLRQRV